MRNESGSNRQERHFFKSNSQTISNACSRFKYKNTLISKPFIDTKSGINSQLYSESYLSNNRSSYSKPQENAIHSLESFLKPAILQFSKPEFTLSKEGYSNYRRRLNIKQSIRLVSNEKYNHKYHVELFPSRKANSSLKNAFLYGNRKNSDDGNDNDAQKRKTNSTKIINDEQKRFIGQRASNLSMKEDSDFTLSNSSLKTKSILSKKASHLKPITESYPAKSKLKNSASLICFKPKNIANKIYIHKAIGESTLKERPGQFYSNQSVINNNPLFQINPRISFYGLIRDGPALHSLFQHNFSNKYCNSNLS